MYLKAELGDGAPAASAFMKDGADASYVGDANVSTSKEGTYILKVKSGGKVRPELLIVRDTKAPTTDTTEAQITIDDKSLDPETALGEIRMRRRSPQRGRRSRPTALPEHMIAA